jgi:hypothetical protein
MDPTRLAQNLDNLHVQDHFSSSIATMSAAPPADQGAPAPPSSGVTAEGLKAKLERELGAVYVEVVDMSGE